MSIFDEIADDEFAVPPRGWKPRPHQQKLWDYLDEGGKRAVAVWHRRAGKDEILLHYMALAAIQRPASYWYCLPLYSQCRKAIWSSVNPHTGIRRIDEAFPDEIRSAHGCSEQEMFLRLYNGSTIQCIGSDQFSTTVGASTAGIVFSEYSLANPSAWAYYRPILEENNGWAAFVSTPRGRNHLLQLYQHAERTDGWFAERLTIDDTGALTPEAVAETVAEYTSLYGEDAGRAMVDQELYCSFNAAILGSFYALEMKAVRDDGRISNEAIADPDRPVNWAWDLGVNDDTALWAFQAVGGQLFILDCYSSSGVGLEHYRDYINKTELEHGWMHGSDYVPHDAKVKEWGSGRTRVETMSGMGLKPLLVPLASVDDGINAVRRTLKVCVFHPRCEAGIDALEQHRREWDDDKKAFRSSPLHDWTSDKADAFRYLSLGWRHAPLRIVKPPKQEGFRLPPPPDYYSTRRGIRL